MKIHRFIQVQTIDFSRLERSVRISDEESVVRTPEKAAVKANVVAGRMVVFISLFVMRYTVFK